MKDKKYCCEKFSFFNRPGNDMALNIRIVKYVGDFKVRMLAINPNMNDKGFVITSGYKNSVNDEQTMRMIINHCPFCGQKLSDFYKSDEYVQETIG